MLADLITFREPPPNRIGTCSERTEHHLSEGGVMLAFAMHVLRAYPLVSQISIHPDGEHGRRFPFKAWLMAHGFEMTSAVGTTDYGGVYRSSGGKTLEVSLRPGVGDVRVKDGSVDIIAECKGGIVNTKHAGQTSRLRKGLCEAVGLLMSKTLSDTLQYAVVPHTAVTAALAEKMAERAYKAGIRIALVNSVGVVTEVAP